MSGVAAQLGHGEAYGDPAGAAARVEYSWLWLASGLTIVFGLQGIVNVAHGVFYMLGAYLGFTAVKVSASTINFLADSGRLQITVTNDLAVPVEDVKLTVEASNPRLRIDSQPPILRIGPKSKATVSVRVTALAAGSVPLRTTLTTPDGTVIGQGADVQVRVTPTGNWVYWGLAALGGLILLLGIVRTVRRRPGTGTALPREATPA